MVEEAFWGLPSKLETGGTVAYLTVSADFNGGWICGYMTVDGDWFGPMTVVGPDLERNIDKLHIKLADEIDQGFCLVKDKRSEDENYLLRNVKW